jgi:hypothetical protein
MEGAIACMKQAASLNLAVGGITSTANICEQSIITIVAAISG